VGRRDLSRTVIEGGRYRRNKWERRESHRVARARERSWLDTLGDADASDPAPCTRVRKMFRDKLAPAERWLAAQAGRPWAKVYSELRARFDSRTVAGRHVVEDHMLDWVRHPGDARYVYRDYFVVDAHGILRDVRDVRRRLARQFRTWTGDRVCANTPLGWWWFRAEYTKPCFQGAKCTAPHYMGPGYIAHHKARYVGVRALTPADRRFLARLPDDLRERVVRALADLVIPPR